MNTKALILTAALGLTTLTSHGSQVIAYWNQNSNALPNGGFGFLADPDVLPQAADQGSGTLTVGGGLLAETTTTTGGDLIYNWIRSFGGSDLNAQGSDPSGGSISILGGTDNGNNGSYFQFNFSMLGFQGLEISYDTRRSNAGFDSQTWSWSMNGIVFTDFQVVDDILTTFQTKSLSSLTSLDDASTAFLRVSFDGATGESGNNRLDNILFEATAIPEPGNFALIGGVSALMLCFRRRIKA